MPIDVTAERRRLGQARPGRAGGWLPGTFG